MLPADKLTIETPEHTLLEFPLAGIGSRALALTLDSLVQFGVLAALGIVAGIVSYAGFFPRIGKQWGYAILIFIGFLVEFGYFAFFETIWNGQTPGKRWTHLRVIMESGRPLETQAAIVRNLMRIVDSLPSLYAVGIIASLISSKHKRVGDYVAGTVVVHETPLQGSHALWEAAASQPLVVAQASVLSANELLLVEAFLDRRASFPEEVRRSMASQIAQRLSHVAPTSDEILKEPEKFLEALAERSRNVAHFR